MNARDWFYGPLGFGSTRGSFPSAETVRKTDEAMARSDAKRCPFCNEDAIDDEGFCQSEECQS